MKLQLKQITIFLIFQLLFALKISAQSKPNVNNARLNLQAAATEQEQAVALIELSHAYLSKDGEFKRDLDSAMLLARQSGALSTKIKYTRGVGESIFLQGQIYREMSNRERALHENKRAMDFFVANHLLKQQGDAQLAFAGFLNIDNELDQKINLVEQAIKLYHQAGAKQDEATALKNLGDYYQLKNAWPRAVKALEESLAIYRSIGFKEIQGVCDLLNYVYCKQGNTTEALKYGLLAVKTAKAVKDSSMQLCTIYNRLAVTYYIMKKNSLAYDSYENALKIAKHYHNAESISIIQFNMAVFLRRLNKPEKSIQQLKELIKNYPPKDPEKIVTSTYLFAQLYMDMGQYQKAKYYVDSLIRMQAPNPFDQSFGMFYNKATMRYYFLTGQYPLVYKYVHINDSIISVNHNLQSGQENELYWWRTDSAQGNMLSALQHFKKYKAINDSIQNQALEKQRSELQLQYDIDNKNQHIQVLTQQDQLQKTRIRNEANMRYVFIASLVVVLIFAGLMYNRSRLKMMSNIALTAKQKEINDKNELLQTLLSEKEWLLKEIHHRVKNNLQIVISLLNTQSSYLESEDAVTAIRNSQQRMYAISLIHQKLYQSENLSTIDMPNYIRELVEYLQECFRSEKRIDFVRNLHPLKLDVVQAVPLGLILNEAISNSVKYAFNEVDHGTISITLEPEDEDHYRLCIKDNGCGLPKGYEPEDASSLGMSLMHGLAQQLNGELKLSSDNGVSVCITFKVQQNGHMS